MCRSGTAARLLASVESHRGELPQAVREPCRPRREHAAAALRNATCDDCRGSVQWVTLMTSDEMRVFLKQHVRAWDRHDVDALVGGSQ